MRRIAMQGEAHAMWLEFITAPENEALLKRYAKYAKEPEPLFEMIGEDLGSTNEEVRAKAYWALVAAMPELTNILHERESRQPGYREGTGQDQRVVNRGMDIVTKLHQVFVKEHRFKLDMERSTDPRSYIGAVARRWKMDEARKLGLVTSLDEMITSFGPDSDDSLLSLLQDPTTSVETEVIESVSLDECRRELLAWGFLDDNEFDLFETVYVDEQPLDVARERLEIPSLPAVRQRLSRARKKAVAIRDEALMELLYHPKNFRNNATEAGWLERAVKSIHPGSWIQITATQDPEPLATVCPLTTGFRDAPGNLYLLCMTHRSLEKHVLEKESELINNPCIQPWVLPRRKKEIQLRVSDYPIEMWDVIKKAFLRLFKNPYSRSFRFIDEDCPAELTGLKRVLDTAPKSYGISVIYIGKLGRLPQELAIKLSRESVDDIAARLTL
jgi:hypothetical protein